MFPLFLCAADHHGRRLDDGRVSVVIAGNLLMRIGLIAMVLQLACFLGLGHAALAEDRLASLEFFEKRVRPLLIEHCYECHQDEDKNGGLALDSKGGWQRGGDSGPAVRPGEPDSSLLVQAIRYNDLELQMPPSGKLPDKEIAILEKWIELGAPDPRDSEEHQPSSATTSQGSMSVDEGRRFWCFLPLAEPTFPSVQRHEWVNNRVDAFVLSRLEQQGLTPAPKADKRSLLRRVTFDLTGLPPTQGELEDFLSDSSPTAWERMVDRLLASPHYGERWGRHWLDVARYADSNGLDENLAFGNAWRFRDYVIDSFNSDKPFNQFVVEQLAGDLLPNATQETVTGTGFLALGAKVLAEPDREKLIMDTVDEQIDATGKVFMGMTLGCARCHDHKFDPIRQDDYYALAAIFKSTETFGESNLGAIKHWYEHSFASDEEKARLRPIDESIQARTSTASKFKNQAMKELREEAVAHAADYLAAATLLKPDATLTEVRRVAESWGLHPRILHHCRLHLEYRQEDPIVAKWLEMSTAKGNPESIQRFFGQLFRVASQDDAPQDAAISEAPPRPAVWYALLSAAKAALQDQSGLIAVPSQPEHAFDGATLEQYYELLEEARLLESAAPDEPAAMGVRDGTILHSLPVHIRGSHRNLGPPVKREFPAVMRTSSVRPIFPRSQSGRLELAQWIASSQHPLTARVYVNRIWGWHFGRGLVDSTENFGQLGQRPSHPQLLDWLARHFMESGWSTKELHRMILTSNTYQMQSLHPNEEQGLVADPENRLLWKFRLGRLEAEAIRDSLLAVSGRLDLTMGGKTVPLRNRQFVFNHTSVDHTRYDSLRRAVYLPVIRNNLYSFFTQFDFPDPTMPTGNRGATVVAPQALLMMNDPLVLDSAVALADRVLRAYSLRAQRVDYIYELALGRLPKADERRRDLQFLEEAAREQQLGERDAWSLYCQCMLMSNEFMYVR